MLYTVDKDRLEKRPEIRIRDKVYVIDNRLSTFERMRRELDKANSAEMGVVISHGIGHDAYVELMEMDLPFGVMEDIVIIILAAIQDLEVEEARKRFRQK